MRICGWRMRPRSHSPSSPSPLTSPLLDPVPEIGVNDPSIRLVPAGEERAVGEISGRREAPGGGIAVFLYALTTDGTRARFTRVQLVSGEKIRRAGGSIVIRQLRAEPG
jgi:hypothetical protein